jgi:aryl-alcohol dehydrogenase-like predicted oxidoreductase
MIYGIANRSGRVSMDEARSIVTRAHGAGLDTIDTAIAYGDSEHRLGEIGVREWRVITKLPPFPSGVEDVERWVVSEVEASLSRLRIPRLHGLLLHQPTDLLGASGADLRSALRLIKNQGLVDAIGLSIRSPDDLDALWGTFPCDLVQAPYNVVDRRIETSGWLSRLRAEGVAVHARSAFLQGLLLMPKAELPVWSQRWAPLWEQWHRWLDQEKVSPIAACLGFSLALPGVERVVVGVDSVVQLAEVITAAEAASPLPPDAMNCEDLDLIDPSRWSED